MLFAYFNASICAGMSCVNDKLKSSFQPMIDLSVPKNEIYFSSSFNVIVIAENCFSSS